MDTDDFPTFGLTLPSHPCEALVGCVIHERYTLEDLLGEGGFGCVFLARQRTPDRMVAVKVSRHHAENADRMVREANVLAKVDHPAIARVYDAGTWDSPLGRRVFVVMELVVGAERLDAYCKHHLPRTTDRVRLFIEVCHAVGVAHQQGIIHRDIKPGNVLVGATGQVKVIDFGIAKVVGTVGDDATRGGPGVDGLSDPDEGTRTGLFMGTRGYAPPEQMTGEPVTPRSDVYAMGELLRSMFGDRPRGLPAGLRRVVDRCTRHDPTQRYAHASELAAALDWWLRRHSVAAWLATAATGLALAAAGWWISLGPTEPRPDPIPLHPGGEPAHVEAGVTTASDPKGIWFVHTGTGNELLFAEQARPLIPFRLPSLTTPGPRPLRFDASGKHLATTDGNGWRLWRVNDLEVNSSGTCFPVPPAAATSALPGLGLDLTADGTRLLGQLGDRQLVAIDVSSGTCVNAVSVPNALDGCITAICRGPDRDTAYVGASDGTVGRWSVGHTTVTSLDHPHGDGRVLIAATPAGDRVASIGADGTLRVRGPDGETLLTGTGLGTPLALTFADATHLLVATRPTQDSRSHLIRYAVPATLSAGRLAITGTAVVSEEILQVSASGTTFLAVTLDRGGEAVTEIWTQPTSGLVSPESVARVSPE